MTGSEPGGAGDGRRRPDRVDGGSGPPAFDGGTETAPEDMNLAELRREIEDIDREIVELVARRTYVADTIAAVKAEQGLPTTDESQEAAVMERAGENAQRFDVDANLVKAIFRLLIELNKVEQRSSR
jgi:chorismate mutase